MHKTLCGTCGLSIRAASTDGCFPTSFVKDLSLSFHSFTNSSVFNSDLHLHRLPILINKLSVCASR